VITSIVSPSRAGFLYFISKLTTAKKYPFS
jgi:hypothetical protein